MDVGGEGILTKLKVCVDMVEDGDWLFYHDNGFGRFLYESGLGGGLGAVC